MATKSEKATQRELRQPDTFQEFGLEAESWVSKHSSLVVGVVVAALGVGLIAAVISWMGNRAEARAAKDLGAALMVLDRPVVNAGEAQLQPTDGSEPPFKTEKEKNEAVVKSLTDFREKNKGTRPAATAALPLAKAEYRLGNYDAALAAYADVLKEAPKNDPLRVSALEGQGYTYEAQGKYAEAAQAFEQMGKDDAGGYLAGMGQYHQARMLILQNKKDEAAKVLAEIPEKFPNTAAARQATERLNLLATQGVKVPTPAPAAPQQQGAPASASQETK